MSENKYRDYLTDDQTFYRQYLKNEDEPVGSSSFTKIITGAAAAVGLAAGASAAYRRGAFRRQLEYLIDKLGDYRQTRMGATLDSVRNWTKDDYWKDIQQMDSWMHRMIGRMQMAKELPRYLAESRAFHDARMAELRRNPIIQDRPFELHAYTRQFESTLRRYEEGSNDIRRQMELNLMRNETRKLMDDAMRGLLVFDREKQEALMRRTGYRQATVRDVWGHLPVEVRRDLEKFERQLASRGANYSIMDKIIDSNILVKQDEKGNIVRFADLRDFRHALARSMDTLAEDFTIPFIKINPLRMFYLNEFTKNDIPRVFADMSKSKVQPYANRNGMPFIGDSVFVNGRLYTFRYEYDEKGNLIGGHFVRAKNPGYLVSARFEGRGSLLARSTKNMMNLYDMEFTQPQGFFKRRIWRSIAEFLDIGFQNERIGHDPEIGDPVSYFSWLARKLHDGFAGWSGWKPYESKIARNTPFGEGAEWLFIPRYKTLKEVNESGGGVKDYFAQFFAGRNNPEDVTTASFIFYTFAERLNATLNQVGVGLNAKHLGSAPQILWNLTMRRVAPVVVGVEAIKYSNYLYENIFGEEYEDQLAHLFVETQLDLARISEKLGITEWAKDMTQILPGFEFISELPIPAITTEGLTPIMLRDIFPLDKTEEELREYYESGEEPVRKGRYWEFGNCVHPDTPIQLADGRLVAAKDVNVGDKVLTHEGTSEKVLRITVRNMEEGEWAPKIYIYGFPEPIITTDNHPYLAVKKKHCPSNSVVDCRPDRQMKICQQCVYPNYCSKQQEWEAKWTLARYLEEGDYLAYPRIKFNGLITEVDGIPLNHDTGYLLGVFLAEGNVSNWNNGKAYGIETIHHEDEKDIAEKLSWIVETYFGDTTSKIKIKEGKALRWRNGKRVVSKWVQQMVYRGREKVFPAYLDQYPEEFALGLLKGIFEGDGHVDKTGADSLQMALTSKRMEHIIAVRNILFAFGIDNSVVNHGNDKYVSYRILVTGDAAKRLYQLIDYRKPCPTSLELTGIVSKHIYIDDNYVYLKIKSIEDSGYFGVVYDYEIENAHSFCGLTVILHNTPFLGSKIEYHQPNWYRRITSDWQYTETLWGSKEEYWDHHWLISPLNHFFLEPYHWEEKHFKDRPYPITGGIPEIENFPLIGPILNATIGQILKPEIIMHQEELQNPGVYRERLGFQLAEALGVIESNTGSPLQSGGIVGVHSGLAGAQTVVQVYSGVTEEKFSGRLEKGEPLAYVTASGQVQIMASTGEASISEINRMLDKSGIAKTGTAEEVELATTPVYENPEEYVNPGMINLALNDFHYNVTEMAGFYGWVSTLFTDRKEAQYEPQLMSSSKAFGYERAFWDKDYGNLGADAMEIFRRFIPRDEHKNYINPLDNRMPTWLPGPEYFINFQEGDPYVKVKKGEMRLPGEAYERLYGIDSEKLMDLEIGASFIGYDVKTIINHWLHRDDVKDNEDDLEGGTKLHKKLEKEFKEEGIAVKTEQRVEDKKHKIYGFYDMYADQRKLLEWAFKEGIEIQYYRAGKGGGEGEYEGYYSSPETVTPEIAAQIVAQSPYATVDIKTRSDKQFQKGELHFENAQQVNFYAHRTGTGVNAIIEYNRDDPEAKPKLYLFDYNPYLYEYSVNKVEVARAAVRQMLDDGAIGRGDLYGPVDRYRILADVAPYSEEFRKLKAQLSKMDLSEAEKEEIRRINKQLSARKEAVRTYDYRFKTANVKDMTVTVKKVIDNNMFLTEEFGEHPIRLAGVYVPTGKDEKGEAARKFIRQYIREGVRLKIAVDADEQNLINDDTYQTISAVVRVGNIRNLNRELIERGLAKEKENDYSPTGVHARFSPAEIAFGKAWETFAHLDTPLHCVAPWTEIITDNGIKRADMLQPGDKVLTHEGRFKPVMAVEPQGIGKRIVDIHLKSSNIPLTVTDDHPILAVKHERKKRITSRGTGEKLEPYGRNPVPKFIFAGDLEAYDYVVYVPRKMVNENATPIIDVLQLNPDRFIEKEGYVYTASGDKYGNLNIKKNGLSLPRFFPVDGNFARLLGYYAAEGCTAKTRGNLTYTLFTFDQDEEEYIQDVCRISEQLFGVTPYIQRKKGTRSVTVRIGCSFLAEMVSKYVGHKTEKRAPEELLINKSLRAEFLRGLLRGDGTKAGYTKYDCIGMAAVQILLWVRDALFDLWKIPSSISLGIQRKNPLYMLYIGKYPELVDFIDGYMEYEEKVFEQPYKNRDKCVVGEWIFYRIKSVETSEYQLETIDIEVADDDTFSTINMAVHNTKLLQVRSPLEQYERREVFGKDWQDWADPMEDYFIPWYQNWISKSPVAAVTLGTVIGSLFGTTRFGRVIGALIGGTASLLGVTYVQAIEGITGERWIPHRRMQEREIEEYFDMLKYVKFRALYEQAADMALEKEGFDVRAYLAEQKKEGEGRKKRLQELREIKRGLLAEKYDAMERAKEIVGRRPNVEAYMKAINQEIEKLQNTRKAERITPIAAQAIQYYNESERTMYAYDPGDPIENLLAALPRKERIYLTKFLKAPEEERERILETVPSYVRRVLQAAWGMKVDEKPDIVEYFTHHQLPGPDWAGWDPRANLDDIKLKLVKREGLDLSEFNFWPEDEKRAERIKDSVVPKMDMESTAAVVKRKLREVLGEAGFRNLQVEVQTTKEPGIEMDIDVLMDRRQEIIQQLNENGYSLI